MTSVDWSTSGPNYKVLDIDDDFLDHLPVILYLNYCGRGSCRCIRRKSFENMCVIDEGCDTMITQARQQNLTLIALLPLFVIKN